MAFIYNWIWPSGPKSPARPWDAALNPALRAHFIGLLDNTEPPNSFKISQVALQLTPSELADLGYESPQEAMPGIIHLAFELREFDDLEIIVKGRLAPDDATPEEVIDMEGPVRVRRKDYSGRILVDRKPSSTRGRW